MSLRSHPAGRRPFEARGLRIELILQLAHDLRKRPQLPPAHAFARFIGAPALADIGAAPMVSPAPIIGALFALIVLPAPTAMPTARVGIS